MSSRFHRNVRPQSATSKGERIQRLKSSDLDDSQRSLYDAIVGGARVGTQTIVPLVDSDGSLEGPFGPLLYAPRTGHFVQSLGATLRTQSSLDDRCRELCTLRSAVSISCQYEIDAHMRLSEHAGVSADEIACLVAGSLPPTLNATENSCIEVVDFSMAGETFDEDDFNRVLAELGETMFVEVILLVGYYRMIGGLLNNFAITEVSA